ncbi:MAG: hypothetical protein II687_05125 [Selenomonadaceae bacterium]|nr:hypothetical protein [Selenomonadaceae bacterium]
MEETKELVLEATVENLSVVNAFIDELLASVEYSLKKRFQLDKWNINVVRTMRARTTNAITKIMACKLS